LGTGIVFLRWGKARGRLGSDTMATLMLENSKLILLFLLIGTIIGLSHCGDEPGHPATRK
jgi:hypothetical protein